uniref:Uncharacterized protein n=1 Tax=Neospora caninum (strain Liverpool) TaxID=572307 RepID=F0JB23_NEOCL|nr:hypothetical protein NCLIV_069460 [Neospora caninum Liverpool]CEL71289.1 TPA: hypothetical protein BN1204_069460 [Neospora caninum Liverpool]
MSVDGGEGAPPGAQQPSMCQDALERMLDGLAVVGRAFRGVYTTSSSCVRRVSYSVKETVVQHWDRCTGNWDTEASRPPKAREGVVYFSGGEESDYGASTSRSTESSA